jgi:hypothetical protein
MIMTFVYTLVAISGVLALGQEKMLEPDVDFLSGLRSQFMNPKQADVTPSSYHVGDPNPPATGGMHTAKGVICLIINFSILIQTFIGYPLVLMPVFVELTEILCGKRPERETQVESISNSAREIEFGSDANNDVNNNSSDVEMQRSTTDSPSSSSDTTVISPAAHRRKVVMFVVKRSCLRALLVFFTFGMVILCGGVLDKMVTLVGALFATSIMFIFPIVAYEVLNFQMRKVRREMVRRCENAVSSGTAGNDGNASTNSTSTHDNPAKNTSKQLNKLQGLVDLSDKYAGGNRSTTCRTSFHSILVLCIFVIAVISTKNAVEAIV